MTSAALWSFVLVAMLVVITPGVDTMLVLRHSLLRGNGHGLLAALGIILGCLVWGVASVAGLTALITASKITYDIVRLLGAGYLIWLGGSALWKSLARTPTESTPDAEVAVTGQGATAWSALRSGFVSNLLNPKAGAFYMSLLPQFLPADPSSAAWGGVLIAIHLTITLTWLPGLVWVAGRARSFFLRQKVRRWMDRVTAGVLLGLGVKIALE